MGPYQFKVQDAEDFARSQGIRFFGRGKEMFFEQCPFCGGTTKDRRTFSIDKRTGRFHCFRSKCGRSGNMITLAQEFGFSLGQNTDEYYKPQRHYKTFNKPEAPIEPKELALEYLEQRGISAEVVRKYQITTVRDELIAFTHFDPDGIPTTIKYRNPKPKEGQSKEFFEPNCKPILFGMMQCNPANKTLIVTEGQIDALSVAQAGIENAVSVPGGVNSYTWVPYCWDWMQQWDRIIIFGDHEHDKITLYKDFETRWKGKVWCVRPEDYKDCKDANDILRKYGPEQIRLCLENAEQPPIPQIIDLSEVEDVDISQMEKLRTGLWRMDEALCGGLPFGQLILITGKAGDGKSTLANQFLISAINEGYRAFMYSGELPNYLLKSWMSFQAAGPRWVKPVKEEGKPGEYVVNPDAKEQISKWFKDKVWIYDNRIVDDEEAEQSKLIELIEAVIIQKGVRVILLDNLMTAMDLEPDGSTQDKYDRQSAFIKKLARLALKHNVIIFLVAHKKKGWYSEVNESVSGSADIINLASIVISYERGGAEDPPDMRWLKVSKNRLYGRLIAGIRMEFDLMTKRIYEEGNTGEKNRWYGWEDEWFQKDEEQLELPWDTEEESDELEQK